MTLSSLQWHRSKCSTRRVALFLLLSLWMRGPASAKEIIVAPSGGDFTNINTALQAAVAGDTVTVRAGTYTQAVTIPKDGLTLRGDSGAIIDGTGQGVTGISISNRSNITVSGLEVRNFKGGDPS